MNMIIGIAGQLASGKDTVADHLAQVLSKETNVNFQRSAFASAVKQVFKDTFKKDLGFIERWKRSDTAPPGFAKNIRQALQFIGDGFRQIKPDIWIEVAMRSKEPRVISDARYLNEANAIKQEGGLNVIVWRPGHENNDPNLSESQIKPLVDWCSKNLQTGPIPKDIASSFYKDKKDVPSVVGQVQMYDYFVINDGTLEQLLNNVVENQLVPFVREYYEI